MSAARRLLLVIGAGFTLSLLLAMDGMKVKANLAKVGWGFVFILGQEILAFAANTVGWWLVFPAERRPALGGRLLRARMAGDAVNYATPTASLGGEVVRVDLVKDEVGATATTTSVAIAKLTQAFGHALYITLGLLLGASALPALEGGPAWTLRAAVVSVWAGAGAFLVVQRVLSLERFVGCFTGSRAASDFGSRVDAGLRELHSRGGTLIASVLCFAAGWATGAIEVWTVLVCLGVEASLATVLAIDALTALVDATLFFMPSKLVALEGGAVAIFEWMGLGGAAGLAFGLARRIRQVVWAAVGLALLAFENRRVFRRWRTAVAVEPGNVPRERSG